jgi:hypothetical protein
MGHFPDGGSSNDETRMINKIRNPKLEIRNKYQLQRREIQNSLEIRTWSFAFRHFPKDASAGQ